MQENGHLISAVCWLLAFVFALMTFLNNRAPLYGVVVLLTLVNAVVNLCLWLKKRKK